MKLYVGVFRKEGEGISIFVRLKPAAGFHPTRFYTGTKTKKRLSALNVLSEMVGRAGFEPATN